MKLLKFGGLVLGIHIILFSVWLSSPGCKSRRTSEEATQTGTLTAEPATPETDTADLVPAGNLLEASPATLPSDAIVSGPVRLPPTRPTSEQLANTAPPPLPEAPQAGLTNYTVEKGDTLSRISKQTGATIDAILKANNLKRSSTLRIGQVLKIPSTTSGAATGEQSAIDSPASYTVAAGDSLYTIARRNGTTIEALRSANSLPNDRLKIGQVLKLPAGSKPSGSGAPPEPIRRQAPEVQWSTPVPSGGARHTVAPGETLGAIARRYSVNAADIMRANGISDPRRLRAGAVITIPGTSAASETPAESVPPPAAEETAAPVESLVPAEPNTFLPSLIEEPAPGVTPLPPVGDELQPLEVPVMPVEDATGTP